MWPARNVPNPSASHQLRSSQPPLAEQPRGRQVVLLLRDPEALDPAPPRSAQAPPRLRPEPPPPASLSLGVLRNASRGGETTADTGAGTAGAGRGPGRERPPLLCPASGLRAFSEKRQVTRARSSAVGVGAGVPWTP